MWSPRLGAYEIAHICPFLNQHTNQLAMVGFWKGMSIYWSKAKVKAWRKAVIWKKETERPMNMLMQMHQLQAHSHSHWYVPAFVSPMLNASPLNLVATIFNKPCSLVAGTSGFSSTSFALPYSCISFYYIKPSVALEIVRFLCFHIRFLLTHTSLEEQVVRSKPLPGRAQESPRVRDLQAC